jgi:hypothetical protein
MNPKQTEIEQTIIANKYTAITNINESIKLKTSKT